MDVNSFHLVMISSLNFIFQNILPQIADVLPTRGQILMTALTNVASAAGQNHFKLFFIPLCE